LVVDGGDIAVTTREALEMAIESEEKAGDTYHELARQAEGPEGRLLFEQLAREEDVHHKRLMDKLKAIRLLG
jgi:rubrerythrin